ncbi:MAG: hypothetical protein HYV95_11245 [Opitutae bacterium]|nr:hypothetical protein [Opitutae bacterium]
MKLTLRLFVVSMFCTTVASALAVEKTAAPEMPELKKQSSVATPQTPAVMPAKEMLSSEELAQYQQLDGAHAAVPAQQTAGADMDKTTIALIVVGVIVIVAVAAGSGGGGGGGY